MPPEDVPLKTGTELPDPATQTVSEHLFLTVNVRVWAAAGAATMAMTMTSRDRSARFMVLYEPSCVFIPLLQSSLSSRLLDLDPAYQ